MHFVENGSRDELKQLGEGEKITVDAWALTARKGLAVLHCFDGKLLLFRQEIVPPLRKVSSQSSTSSAQSVHRASRDAF